MEISTSQLTEKVLAFTSSLKNWNKQPDKSDKSPLDKTDKPLVDTPSEHRQPEISMSRTSKQSKCGWLRKLGGGVVKTMHRRWFVLNDSYLFYFIKEDDSKPQGIIPLHGYRIIQHPVSPDELDKYLLEFVPDKATQRVPAGHETYLLCASSEEERQDWVKAIKKTKFAAIGGDIFGSSLEEAMMFEKTRSGLKVPYIVDACIKFLTEYGLEVEGLFRLPGRMLLVRDLKNKFDEGEQVVLTIDEYDVHSVASLLKQYLRELPECLIPYSFYQDFMNVAMRFQGTKYTKDKLDEVESLHKAMASVPKDNYYVLKYLCRFLHEVANKTEVNKMTAQNLARVFGPNIIRHPQMEDNPEIFMLTTADLSEQLAYMLISYEQQIFTIEFDQGRQSAHVAVDDLLGMNSMASDNGMLLLESCLAPCKGRNGSNIEDLSDIFFEQRGDRRARTFQSTELYKNGKTDQSLCLQLSSLAKVEDGSSPPSDSAGPSPVNEICFLTLDEKPIPPLRRKYTRNRSTVCEKKSNDSISSEYSGSENSIEDDQSDIRNQINLNIPQLNDPNTAMSDLEQKLTAMIAEYNNLSARYDTLHVSKAKTDADVKYLSAELNQLQLRYDNFSASKAKSDEELKNLTTEMSKMMSKHEEHIKSIEAKHQSQLNEMYTKLNECTSNDDALQKITELQKMIQSYQQCY